MRSAANNLYVTASSSGMTAENALVANDKPLRVGASGVTDSDRLHSPPDQRHGQHHHRQHKCPGEKPGGQPVTIHAALNALTRNVATAVARPVVTLAWMIPYANGAYLEGRRRIIAPLNPNGAPAEAILSCFKRQTVARQV
jgi:hypothetical protein